MDIHIHPTQLRISMLNTQITKHIFGIGAAVSMKIVDNKISKLMRNVNFLYLLNMYIKLTLSFHQPMTNVPNDATSNEKTIISFAANVFKMLI